MVQPLKGEENPALVRIWDVYDCERGLDDHSCHLRAAELLAEIHTAMQGVTEAEVEEALREKPRRA